ncbi:BACK domain-containing protein [Caerostris darwini]|uniref:BACK domain-containing protein n=1 Tax=Caerostris darwini TaxID=1538125 RepID=A0AAV4NKH1_9ARAC|nr:BACK domain-containing protein [Caerostris darwini]
MFVSTLFYSSGESCWRILICEELQIPSVTNDAFATLLQYMYTANLALTCQNIGEVYTAARKLGMDGALELSVKILTGKSRHDVHSVYTYVTARKLGLPDAASRSLRTMTKRFEQIVGTTEYLDLTFDQVMDYLKSDSMATRSEVIVFLAALKWISVQYLEREQFAVDVIGCVRFPMMSINEILACHAPPLLPGLMEIPEVKQMLLKATWSVSPSSLEIIE